MAKEASENNLKLRILNNQLKVGQHRREVINFLIKEKEKQLEVEEEKKIELERRKDIVKEINIDKDNFKKDRKDYVENMHKSHQRQMSVFIRSINLN